MRDPEDHTTASSSHHSDSKQPAERGSAKQRSSGSGAQPAHASASNSAADRVKLSRRWAGPGASVTITVAGRAIKPLVDWRVLWGSPDGGDGYTLLLVSPTEGRDHSISFNVPATARPGAYAIQVEHKRDLRQRLQFIVTSHEPPESSPFRILRTDPADGALKLYQTLCRYRSNPETAIEAMATLMKGYDTFLDPRPVDAEFKEIVEGSLRPIEKRQKFASWLVTHQLSAEEGA